MYFQQARYRPVPGAQSGPQNLVFMWVACGRGMEDVMRCLWYKHGPNEGLFPAIAGIGNEFVIRKFSL